MNITVSKYSETPTGKKLKNKFIVYDKDTMKPLSGVSGTSKILAYRTAKYLKELQKLQGKTITELQKIVTLKSKYWGQASGILYAKKQTRLAKLLNKKR